MIRQISFLIGIIIICFHPLVGIGEERSILVGFLEWVVLEPVHVKIKAKIDTGADTSSLGIDGLNMFERDGVSWVRFGVTPPGDESVVIERRLLRMARIRQVGNKMDVRPVVMLDICLGENLYNTEVNLVSRKGMKYPMLLGRRFFGKQYMIKPSARFLTTPSCKRDETRE